MYIPCRVLQVQAIAIDWDGAFFSGVPLCMIACMHDSFEVLRAGVLTWLASCWCMFELQ
jgi:hypothetical protein